MKLIIDIDDKVYEEIKDRDNTCGIYIPHGYASIHAIENGTPLPKGYGDLVDFDKLCEEYWDGNYMEIHKDDLSNIKPIIEKDEED